MLKPNIAKRFRFLVAGDSEAAGMVAVNLGHETGAARLLTEPGSAAALAATEANVQVVTGRAWASGSLTKAGIAESTHLILFPRDLGEMFRCLGAAAESYNLKRADSPLQLFVALPDQNAIDAVRKTAIGFVPAANLRVQFFSLAEDAASDFIFEHFGANAGALQSGEGLDFVLVGQGEVAETVALKLARMGGGLEGSKLKLNWVLPKAGIERAEAAYKGLRQTCDLNLYSRAADGGLPLDLPLVSNRAPVLVIADQTGNLETLFCSGRMLTRFFRVYIFDPFSDQLESCFRTVLTGLPGSELVRFFGGISRFANYRRFVEVGRFGLAKAIHQNYCEARKAEGEMPKDNPSILPWDEITEDLRRANIEQADHIFYKLALLGYRLDKTPVDQRMPPATFSESEIEAMARLEHARWVADRQLSGWAFGKVRDNELKRHPMLVDYAQLPESEKEKDRQAVRTIPNVLHRAGLTVRSL